MEYGLILSLLAGIILLLALILWVRIQAFLALLIASIVTGVLAGMPPLEIIQSVRDGMAGTLGFIATVVGLGAIFGAMLEHSGGAFSVASWLTKRSDEKGGASLAMLLTGFVIAIPVFFDVAFIILTPVLFSLQQKTEKSLLLYGIPLLAGLAVSHSFIPPTPGPIAVAEILGADLGRVILIGILAGLPAAYIGGLVYGNYIGKKIFISSPSQQPSEIVNTNPPTAGSIFFIILLPIILILLSTFLGSPLFSELKIPDKIIDLLGFIGHPFTALIIANLAAWYFLGIRRGLSKDQLFKISSDSLAPAGTIILITGAGGVFKEVLTDTGVGKMLALYLSEAGFTPMVFAFSAAALIRILQGSATVAMITSAGMTSALIGSTNTGEWEKALLVIAIASGATVTSHVNDSGFWLVGRYFRLTEQETLKTWTVSTTLIGITGFLIVLFLSFLL